MPRGGKREGAGRKTKAEEMGLPKLIEDCIGEEGKRAIILKIKEQAEKGSFAHQELLMHYIFGKPSNDIDITTNGKDFSTKEIIFRDYAKSGI